MIYLIISLLSISLSACVSAPSAQFQEVAQRYDVSETTISGEHYEHAVFRNATFDRTSTTKTALHIYIEGDGQPLLHQRFINQDPTSTAAIALKLMALDSFPALLIGRPCYHARKNQHCNDSKVWTSHRYSEAVVESMAKVINTANIKKQNITLIGFSGGGSLAMLLSERVKFLTKVVTINANLDTDAWTTKHGYTPLFGSLNPIDKLPSNINLKQLHLVGDRDQNVSHLAWRERAEASGGKIIRFADFTHTCCWHEIWPEILEQHVN